MTAQMNPNPFHSIPLSCPHYYPNFHSSFGRCIVDGNCPLFETFTSKTPPPNSHDHSTPVDLQIPFPVSVCESPSTSNSGQVAHSKDSCPSPFVRAPISSITHHQDPFRYQFSSTLHHRQTALLQKKSGAKITKSKSNLLSPSSFFGNLPDFHKDVQRHHHCKDKRMSNLYTNYDSQRRENRNDVGHLSIDNQQQQYHHGHNSHTGGNDNLNQTPAEHPQNIQLQRHASLDGSPSSTYRMQMNANNGPIPPSAIQVPAHDFYENHIEEPKSTLYGIPRGTGEGNDYSRVEGNVVTYSNYDGRETAYPYERHDTGESMFQKTENEPASYQDEKPIAQTQQTTQSNGGHMLPLVNYTEQTEHDTCAPTEVAGGPYSGQTMPPYRSPLHPIGYEQNGLGASNDDGYVGNNFSHFEYGQDINEGNAGLRILPQTQQPIQVQSETQMPRRRFVQKQIQIEPKAIPQSHMIDLPDTHGNANSVVLECKERGVVSKEKGNFSGKEKGGGKNHMKPVIELLRQAGKHFIEEGLSNLNNSVNGSNNIEDRRLTLGTTLELLNSHQDACKSRYDYVAKYTVGLCTGAHIPIIMDTMTAPVDDETADDAEMKLFVKQRFVEAIQKLQMERVPKKRRGNLPKEATDLLKKWFDAHYNRPYPSEEEKAELCRIAQIDLAQVSHWFINYRKRVWKPSLPEDHPALKSDYHKRRRRN